MKFLLCNVLMRIPAEGRTHHSWVKIELKRKDRWGQII